MKLSKRQVPVVARLVEELQPPRVAFVVEGRRLQVGEGGLLREVGVGVVVVGRHRLLPEPALHAVPPRVPALEEFLLEPVEPACRQPYGFTGGG